MEPDDGTLEPLPQSDGQEVGSPAPAGRRAWRPHDRQSQWGARRDVSEASSINVTRVKVTRREPRARQL